MTIIVPTFNAARTIGRAIDSVVAQTFADWHLVCVDDASTDQTVEIVRSYGTRLAGRLQILDLATNGGPAHARNHGLRVATGEWIAVLDADDAWRPERLTDLLQRARRENADAVCDNLVGFDDHRQRETDLLFTTLPRSLDIATTVAAEYQGRYNLGYLKPVVRRSFLEMHVITYDEALRTGEDLLFLLRCLAKGAHIVCHQTSGYVYTTPIGHGSGKISRSTTTSPRDADLVAGLQRFVAESETLLTSRDHKAIERRIAYLRAIAPLAIFRHARLNHDWCTAVQVFCASPQVRHRVWAILRSGRRSCRGTWA